MDTGYRHFTAVAQAPSDSDAQHPTDARRPGGEETLELLYRMIAGRASRREFAGSEEIVIAKAGKPYLRLVSCLPEQSPRPLGGWEGKVWIADDFDETPEEVIPLFEGKRSSRPRRAPRR